MGEIDEALIMMRSGLLLFATVCLAATVDAQIPLSGAFRTVGNGNSAVLQMRQTLSTPFELAKTKAVEPNGSGAFLIEALAGSVGSLVGIGIIGLTSHCGVEDLGCIITSVGAGGLLGAIGATLGATLAAHETGSRRSVGGAAVGAVVGTGVGLGVHYLLNSNSDRNLGDAIVIPIFVISQGTFAALGSRLMGSNR
jgi:hypothetical protein